MRRALLVLLGGALGIHGTAWAETMPPYTVATLCDKAEVVLEGTHLGGNTVRIDRIHKDSPLLDKSSGTVEVTRLEQYYKRLHYYKPDEGLLIGTKTLVLFLTYAKPSNNWGPFCSFSVKGRGGGLGAIWFDDLTCYSYFLDSESDSWALQAAWQSRGITPLSIDKLREEIAKGLAGWREWQRSLAIENPVEKAQALSRYLLKSTSPKGDKGIHQHDILDAIRSLGSFAVPVLIRVLKDAPASEDLSLVVRSLGLIGPPASPAVPELVALLAQPTRGSVEEILHALGAIGDPRAIPYVEEYVHSSNKRLSSAASRALEALHTRQAEHPKEATIDKQQIPRRK